MVKTEYNSPFRQDRCKNYLSSLRLSKFEKEEIEISAPLEKVHKAIKKLAPHVPQSHLGEAHRIDILRKTVIGYGWAIEPLSSIATHTLHFQQLYGELEYTLPLSKETLLARRRDDIVGLPTVKDDVTGILYQS